MRRIGCAGGYALPGAGVVLVSALLATSCPGHAQGFVPQFGFGTSPENPRTYALPPDSDPPDLNEPEPGEDPETAPFAEDEEPHRKRPKRPRKVFAGQNHDPAPPLPLLERLRRVLRASPLGGSHDFWFTRKAPRDVYFTAFEATARDRFVTIGSKHAIRGTLDSPGWRFLSTLGIKISAYDPLGGGRTSHIDTARTMAGYEWRFGPLSLSAFAGPGYARNAPQGILQTGQFGRYGASTLLEAWFNWGEAAPLNARYSAGYVLLESANRSGSIGLRHGIKLRILPFTLGPEASWSAGKAVGNGVVHSTYRKARLGVHASEIPLFNARLRLSAGAEWRDGNKAGAYTEISAYLPY